MGPLGGIGDALPCSPCSNYCWLPLTWYFRNAPAPFLLLIIFNIAQFARYWLGLKRRTKTNQDPAVPSWAGDDY